MTEKLQYFTTERLGRTQSLTPDGFLLATDVPIARTGVQLYCDADGIPVKSDKNGIIRVHREPSEVFNPIAIASFAGKPVTDDHPDEVVGPDNWKDYSVGVVLNPRRGDGMQYDKDFLYADLLITDKEAIKAVRDGKRQVSAGYNASYEQIRPGEGRQHQIIGNHVALVDRGRCGPSCAVGDSATKQLGDKGMAKAKTPAWMDRIIHAFNTNDESMLVSECDKIKEMLGETFLGTPPNYSAGYAKVPSRAKDADKDMDKEDKEDKTEDSEEKMKEIVKDAISKSLATYDSRMGNLERAVAILATKDADKEDEDKDKEETKDADKEMDKEDKEDGKEDEDKQESKDKKSTKDTLTTDSKGLKVSWQELISRAEFLAPGIKHPTFDAKNPAKLTIDAMCKFRRKVLDEAMKEDDTKAAIQQVAGDPKVKLSSMTCDSIALIYNGASELMRQANSQTQRPGNGMNYNSGAFDAVDIVRNINQSNKSFWAKNSPSRN